MVLGKKSIDIQQSNEQIARFSAEQGSHRKVVQVKSSTKDSNKVIYEAISNASQSSHKRKEQENGLQVEDIDSSKPKKMQSGRSIVS